MFLALIKRLKRSDRGAAAIEFAFALPIIIIISFAFFEFCQVVFTQTMLSYSAAQASRFAMVNFQKDNVDINYIDSVKADIQTYAEDSYILIDDAKVSSFDIEVIVDIQKIKTVNVKIDYAYDTNIPMLPDYSFILTGESDAFLVQ
jgi:Flp pilus assembly protein TadG